MLVMNTLYKIILLVPDANVLCVVCASAAPCRLSNCTKYLIRAAAQLNLKHWHHHIFLLVCYVRHVLEQVNQMYLPIVNAWQLNERHYG